MSNITFLIVLAGMLLLNWRAVVALLGSFTLLAGFLRPCRIRYRHAAGHRTGAAAQPWAGSQQCATPGPALAAIGIAFNDDPAILGAVAAVLLSGLVAALPTAAVLSRQRADDHA